MSLKSIVQKRISSWPQQAITVLYCNNVFGDELSQWNKSSMFQDVSYVQVENGSRYAIKQWCAQPTTIASQSVQVILDPHHILVNNRARVCAHGSDGMNISKKAWHDVAEYSRKNRTNLSLELVKELRDRQRNSYAQTTFSEPVEKEMKNLGFLHEAE